jgi:hypothetical protein
MAALRVIARVQKGLMILIDDSPHRNSLIMKSHPFLFIVTQECSILTSVDVSSYELEKVYVEFKLIWQLAKDLVNAV